MRNENIVFELKDCELYAMTAQMDCGSGGGSGSGSGSSNDSGKGSGSGTGIGIGGWNSCTVRG